MPRSFRFIHSFGIEFVILKTELLENRLIVWNIEDSKRLFSQGYYGKPIGITKPKLNEINVPLVLDLIEDFQSVFQGMLQYVSNEFVEEEFLQHLLFFDRYCSLILLEQLRVQTYLQIYQELMKAYDLAYTKL